MKHTHTFYIKKIYTTIISCFLFVSTWNIFLVILKRIISNTEPITSKFNVKTLWLLCLEKNIYICDGKRENV